MKSIQSFAPTLTEYRQTVFRSKSEAVFARSLDLVGALWNYEPFAGKKGVPGGHHWDFLIFLPCLKRQFAHVGSHVFLGEGYFVYSPWFIEYKPARPTRTYTENLISKLESWDGQNHYGNYGLIYGNPWDVLPGDFAYFFKALLFENKRPSREPYDMEHDYFYFFQDLNGASKEAMSYRYDLCNLALNQDIKYKRVDE